MKALVSERLIAKYGMHPDKVFFAPGRINLIGEHIDYNGGLVLPAAISLGLWAAVSYRNDDKILVFAESFNEEIELVTNGIIEAHTLPDWGKYIAGMLHFSIRRNAQVKGANIYLYSTLPIGAGLSSSAALECLFGYIFAEDYYAHNLTQLALDAREAEHQYAGVQCGIMDQYAVAYGKKDQAILLDCSAVSHQYVPLKLGKYSLLIINSNKPRTLIESKYNERRTECEQALEIINDIIPTTDLCHANQLALAYIDDEVLYHRAKHALTEQMRVEAAVHALEVDNMEELGQLLTASHQSLSEDFEVSCEEMDDIVHFATHHPACLGARMMGGGFGGCCIALVEREKEKHFSDYVSRKYHTKTGLVSDIFRVEIVDGVRAV